MRFGTVRVYLCFARPDGTCKTQTIFTRGCAEEDAQAIVDSLMEANPGELRQTYAQFIPDAVTLQTLRF